MKRLLIVISDMIWDKYKDDEEFMNDYKAQCHRIVQKEIGNDYISTLYVTPDMLKIIDLSYTGAIGSMFDIIVLCPNVKVGGRLQAVINIFQMMNKNGNLIDLNNHKSFWDDFQGETINEFSISDESMLALLDDEDSFYDNVIRAQDEYAILSNSEKSITIIPEIWNPPIPNNKTIGILIREDMSISTDRDHWDHRIFAELDRIEFPMNRIRRDEMCNHRIDFIVMKNVPLMESFFYLGEELSPSHKSYDIVNSISKCNYILIPNELLPYDDLTAKYREVLNEIDGPGRVVLLEEQAQWRIDNDVEK